MAEIQEGSVFSVAGSGIEKFQQTPEGPIGLQTPSDIRGESTATDIGEISYADFSGLFTAAGRESEIPQFSQVAVPEAPATTSTASSNIIDGSASLIAGAASQLPGLQAGQATAQGNLDTAQAALIEGMGATPAQDARASAQEELGIDLKQDFAGIQAAVATANATRLQVAALVAEREQVFANLETNARGSAGYISRRRQNLQTEFSRRENSLAALLGAQAQNIAALTGNINMARGLINDVVEAATFDVTFQRQNLESFINVNQSTLARLDAKEQAIFNNALDQARLVEGNAREDMLNKFNLVLENPQAGVTFQDALTMSLDEVGEAVRGEIGRKEALEENLAIQRASNTGQLTLPSGFELSRTEANDLVAANLAIAPTETQEYFISAFSPSQRAAYIQDQNEINITDPLGFRGPMSIDPYVWLDAEVGDSGGAVSDVLKAISSIPDPVTP